jgi:large subunit ribosomal protein L29
MSRLFTDTVLCPFRNLSNEQIDEKVRKLKAELFGMRIKFAKREEYKPAQYQETRKNIARLLTIKREREVAEGVSRRESLRAERRKLVDAGLGNF